MEVRLGWRVTKNQKHANVCFLKVAKVCFFRKMMRIPWTDKVRNEDLFRRAWVDKKLLRDVRFIDG